MVNDLQGFRRGPIDKEEYVLTDPAISCIQRQFDLTDLGEQGIEYFFKKHECNFYCNALKLSQIIKLSDQTELKLKFREEKHKPM
jgi:hypothetical protein